MRIRRAVIGQNMWRLELIGAKLGIRKLYMYKKSEDKASLEIIVDYLLREDFGVVYYDVTITSGEDKGARNDLIALSAAMDVSGPNMRKYRSSHLLTEYGENGEINVLPSGGRGIGLNTIPVLNGISSGRISTVKDAEEDTEGRKPRAKRDKANKIIKYLSMIGAIIHDTDGSVKSTLFGDLLVRIMEADPERMPKR